MAKKAKTQDSNAPQDDFVGEVENSNKQGVSTPQNLGEAETSSAPVEKTNEAQFGSDASAIPVENPPSDSFGSTEDGLGAAVWYDNKKITGLWTKNETRNSWAAVSGLGWKKLNSSNDTSCTALTILAAHARSFNKNVKLQLEDDQIKEIYVW